MISDLLCLKERMGSRQSHAAAGKPLVGICEVNAGARDGPSSHGEDIEFVPGLNFLISRLCWSAESHRQATARLAKPRCLGGNVL
jgi:hypothetical protein